VHGPSGVPRDFVAQARLCCASERLCCASERLC
jgi:hypothetical protein